MENFYLGTVSCPNCGYTRNHKIPRGTTIEDYKEEQSCDNCGCGLVKRPISPLPISNKTF